MTCIPPGAGRIATGWRRKRPVLPSSAVASYTKTEVAPSAAIAIADAGITGGTEVSRICDRTVAEDPGKRIMSSGGVIPSMTLFEGLANLRAFGSESPNFDGKHSTSDRKLGSDLEVRIGAPAR